MSIAWTDSSSGTQLLAGDNSGNVNIGVGVPTAALSVNGAPVVANGALAQNTVASESLLRFQGAIALAANGTATISGATFAGIGSADNGGIIYTFNLPSSFGLANPSQTATITFNYAVI